MNLFFPPKSTLLSLIVRLADTQSGWILIDGRDITRMPLPELRRLVTLVARPAAIRPAS